MSDRDQERAVIVLLTIAAGLTGTLATVSFLIFFGVIS